MFGSQWLSEVWHPWTSQNSEFPSLEMLWQAFTATTWSCCLFQGLSAFSFVFAKWKAALSNLWSGDWKKKMKKKIRSILLRNSWVASTICFGSSPVCTVKVRVDTDVVKGSIIIHLSSLQWSSRTFRVAELSSVLNLLKKDNLFTPVLIPTQHFKSGPDL